MTQQPRQVLLALDVGDARIGVAISRSGVIAEPLDIVERGARRQTLDAIEAIVEANHVTHVVVGLPLLAGGREGEQAEKTRAFARSLARRLPAIRISYQDESHSSGDADEIAAGNRRAYTHADHLAAAVILREYLENRTRLADEKKVKGTGEHD